jgi:hypothetical protein
MECGQMWSEPSVMKEAGILFLPIVYEEVERG